MVTICVDSRMCLFGEVRDASVELSPAGHMIQENWLALPARFPGFYLDEFTVMPNHLHGIVMIGASEPETAIAASEPAGKKARATPELGAVIGAFKSITTVEYGRGVKAKLFPGYPTRLWQRNYFESVIWEADELIRSQIYIRENPKKWESDQLHPQNPNKS